MYGDSITWEASAYLRYFFRVETGRDLRVRATGGLAPCDWVETIRRDLAVASPPRSILLQFYGNNITRCADHPIGSSAFLASYRAAFDEVRRLASASGTRVLWVVSPPRHAVEPVPDLPRTLADMARRRGWSVIDPSGAVAGPQGEWIDRMPCLTVELGLAQCEDGEIEVRSADLIHFGGEEGGHRSGAMRCGRAHRAHHVTLLTHS